MHFSLNKCTAHFMGKLSILLANVKAKSETIPSSLSSHKRDFIEKKHSILCYIANI